MQGLFICTLRLSIAMPITAHQIELFQLVYRHRSNCKAAEAFNISQPAISRMVADLETEMTVVMFDRSGRKPLADAGQISAPDLAATPQLILPTGSPFRRAVEHMFDRESVSFHIRAVACTLSALVGLAARLWAKLSWPQQAKPRLYRLG